jgi:hypothetical protein
MSDVRTGIPQRDDLKLFAGMGARGRVWRSRTGRGALARGLRAHDSRQDIGVVLGCYGSWEIWD